MAFTLVSLKEKIYPEVALAYQKLVQSILLLRLEEILSLTTVYLDNWSS